MSTQENSSIPLDSVVKICILSKICHKNISVFKEKVEIHNYFWKVKYSYKTLNSDSQKMSNFNTVNAHSNINSFEHPVKIPTA